MFFALLGLAECLAYSGFVWNILSEYSLSFDFRDYPGSHGGTFRISLEQIKGFVNHEFLYTLSQGRETEGEPTSRLRARPPLSAFLHLANAGGSPVVIALFTLGQHLVSVIFTEDPGPGTDTL